MGTALVWWPGEGETKQRKNGSKYLETSGEMSMTARTDPTFTVYPGHPTMSRVSARRQSGRGRRVGRGIGGAVTTINDHDDQVDSVPAPAAKPVTAPTLMTPAGVHASRVIAGNMLSSCLCI